MLAGEILGAAAVLYDGLNSVQTETYGAAARGSLAYSDVIISDETIDYTRIEDPDILIVLDEVAYEKFGKNASTDCVIIYDPKTVKIEKGRPNHYEVPSLEISRENLEHEEAANIIMLGATVAITGIVSKEAVKKATLERVPEGTEGLNKLALEKGFEAGKKQLDKNGKEEN
ncbi:hypothetical protein AKJ39_03030 [candidate division MSBL1 archaeon SCGC-AAA259J03]|uniref:Pyruvate/ketoisovalerate oxidoreductase catalytic domain-containing protein n=1 Tax=candidate division MSBL1 archaeon SCGC-AAA259J03 TaxID=1698269 RepID=A0A656YW03_9EURY|nr:hypothetical protein AKJ39_03030 [candidate division MSBL1 archaeon SCGC-AAA259J03]